MRTPVVIQVKLKKLDQSQELSVALPAALPVREAPMLSELFCNYMI